MSESSNDIYREELPESFSFEGEYRLCLEANLLANGSYGQEWLVVTDAEVLVYRGGEENVAPVQQISLETIDEIESINLVGGGVLTATTNGNQIELVRFTDSHSPRFSSVAEVIGKWAKGEDADTPEEKEKRCPKCGKKLEEGSSICPRCAPKSRTARRLVSYLKNYVPQAILLCTASILSTVLGLLPPYLQKPLMDRVLAPVVEVTVDQRLQTLGWLVLALLGARVLMSVVSIGQSWLSTWLGSKLTHDIRCALYDHLQFLSLRYFDKRQVGSVISRVNQDSNQLERFLVWGSQDLAKNILLLIGIGVMLFVMSWKLALFVFLPTPIVVFISVFAWKKVRTYIRRYFHRWGRLNALLNETLSGLRVVKAFAQEEKEIERFHERSDAVASAAIIGERMWSGMFGVLVLVIALGTLVVWYAGGRDVVQQNGNMTLGTFVSFMTYVAMFYGPVQALSMLMNWASRSLTAAERVFEVLDQEPEVVEDEDAQPMPDIEGRVEFKNVRFGYDRHQPVLKNFAFEVEPGEMIGLVGHSGAGKSTTMNLVCRFYDVDEGQVLIDGVPINRIKYEDLRSQIGLVPQDTILFSGTIADNIAYAKEDATHEDIVRAAMIANAHEFIIKKPDAYDTIVGEKGQGLSGGERQRIAIARAMIHDPRIIILDEATSHVDVETESKIQEAIERMSRGRTTFAIAHRLATLKNADRLVVLKDGEISEIGSHDELLENEGEFSRLVKTYQEISRVQAIER